MPDGFMDVGVADEAIICPFGEDEPGRILQMDRTRIEIPMLVRLEAEVKDEINRGGDEGIPFRDLGRFGFIPETTEVDSVHPRPIYQVPLEQELDLEIPRLHQMKRRS